VTQMGLQALQDGVGESRVTQVATQALQQSGATRVTQLAAMPIWRYSRPVRTETQYLRRLRRAPHLCNEQKAVYYHEFELDMEVGIGNAEGLDGDDPQVMLRWSDDGGHTWSNEHWVSAGELGDYTKRVVWRRLGRARDRIFELTVTDPVAWRFLDAFVRTSGGKH
jgi:hypothetical protein